MDPARTPCNTPINNEFKDDFAKLYGPAPVKTSIYPTISETVIRKEIMRLEELEKEAADTGQHEEAHAYAQCKTALNSILFY